MRVPGKHDLSSLSVPQLWNDRMYVFKIPLVKVFGLLEFIVSLF